ncbi:hypothetical protein NDU88_001203 [Pleurodeles waltl]|uniref:Uncharacterized protein n=1 Tax=Pleurodeles waltl TaxID=8319 RepID=A0AAV7THN1_PLEWA|nr:hypothetical protein NDU88_001203 [Pleurodeles waltl]
MRVTALFSSKPLSVAALVRPGLSARISQSHGGHRPRLSRAPLAARVGGSPPPIGHCSGAHRATPRS